MSLQCYSVIITVLIQFFNCFSIYYRATSGQDIFFYIKYSRTSTVLITIDCTLWILFNSCIMFRTISLSTQFCNFFNIHVKYQSNQILFLTKIYVLIIIIGIPLTNIFSHGISCIAMFITLSHYGLMCQFLVNHLHEWTIFEKLTNCFKNLQTELMTDVHKFLTHFDEYTTVSKKAIKLFEVNKVVGLSFTLILFSFYMFYGYEYIVSGSLIRFKYFSRKKFFNDSLLFY